MGRELAQIALRTEDRISRAATETMEQQKTQILRIKANEATLKAKLVQTITSFPQNYHNLNTGVHRVLLFVVRSFLTPRRLSAVFNLPATDVLLVVLVVVVVAH